MKLLGIPFLVSVALAMPRMADIRPRQLPLSQNEGNSGPIDSPIFNAQDQFVDVRPGTTHQYIAPGTEDLRGPCSGLNAAANHGFLPRNGITTISQTVAGLSQAYALGPEFSAVLSVIAIALTGDPTTQTWSIGGSYSPGLLGGLLSNPSGLTYSHNTYESDASPTRADAYLNNGEADSLILSKFQALYNSAQNYTLDILRDHNKQVHDYSINNNPYFSRQYPFAGLVPPIAHHFIINLMSNHSADNTNGFLTRDVLKSFFAITGPDNAQVYNKAQEKIPLNWYRRPSTNPYGAAAAFADVAILATKYPDIVSVGGNTGTVNSFTGVDPGDLTGGVFNSANLLQGNNLGCFALQAARQAIPSVLSGVLNDLTPILNLVNQYLSHVLQSLNCPALLTLDQSKFNQFPGYAYHPRP